ncbi:MAG: carboxypeptidase regulatory-like domain-containing protein, partial [Planctomycetaceae bacterium]|nr:carboxypeptidase regulatory-like domain-containing protein [Planctomycetaceae bacterium]
QPAAGSTISTSLRLDEEPASITVSGTVVDADGQPVPGAFVAVGATDPRRREENYGDQLLGEATTGSDGRFTFQLSGVSSKTHLYPKVFARTDESAIAWSVFDLDEGSDSVTLTLQRQQLIEGQLVDLDGQPAAGVAVQVQSVMITPVSEDAGSGLRNVAASRAAVPWFTTDDDGRFTIRNLGPGHGVYLNIAGDDRFAPQEISLNTGAAETRTEFDATYRPYTKNLQPGEHAVIPLAPAQLFEGVVLLGDTDQPAANAKISIWASQQENGSMTTVEGRTDANGRFKLNPNPGIKFGIQAFAPDGTPFMVKQLRDLRWTSDETTRTMQIRLPPGVLVTGTVTDAVTGAPISNAHVQYYPDQAHNQNYNDDLIVRWQGAQPTNDAGEFAIAVPAGPGTLLVHAESPNYILEERGSQELDRGQAGGERTYAHAFAKIDPAAGESPAPLAIQITPGATVNGRLVDSDGKPIAAAKMVSRLKIVWHSPQWRAFSDDVTNGQFEISGLREGVEYPVYFVDVERGLGASATISTADAKPTIVLQPCGSAKAKLVDQDGGPIDSRSVGVHMVVTPGPSQFSQLAYRMGLLMADEDYYSNITRIFSWDNAPATPGEATFDLLIPGATYRVPNPNGGMLATSVDFTVESGETRDLGTIELEISK